MRNELLWEIIDLADKIRFNLPEMVRNRNQKRNRPRNFSGPRRRNRSHNTGRGKISGEKKYVLSLEQYWSARRKYFEFFHRAQGRRLDKLKRNFYRSLEELRRLEKEFKKDSKGEDLTYSTNHNLDPHPKDEKPETGEDFYVLRSQQEADFQKDTEESVGSMEDYLSYKGKAG